jgi:hypothetical protein
MLEILLAINKIVSKIISGKAAIFALYSLEGFFNESRSIRVRDPVSSSWLYRYDTD